MPSLSSGGSSPLLCPVKKGYENQILATMEKFDPETKAYLATLKDKEEVLLEETYLKEDIEKGAKKVAKKVSEAPPKAACREMVFHDCTHYSFFKRLKHATRFLLKAREPSIVPCPPSSLEVKKGLHLDPTGLHVTFDEGFRVLNERGLCLFQVEKGRGFLVGAAGARIDVYGNRGYLHYKESAARSYVVKQTIEKLEKPSLDEIIIYGDLITQNGEIKPYKVFFSTKESYGLRVKATCKGLAPFGVYQSSLKEQKTHAMGAQTTSYLKEDYREISTREHGLDRQDNHFSSFLCEFNEPFSSGSIDSTYSFAPLFFHHSSATNTSRIDFFRSASRTVFEKKAFHYLIRVDQDSFDFISYQEDSPEKVMAKYTAHTGKMAPPPSWSKEGLILGIKRDFSDIHKVLDQICREVQVAAVWIEDWPGSIYSGWWRIVRDWRLCVLEKKGWLMEVSKLKKKHNLEGVLTYFSPTASRGGDLFNKAKELGYLVKGEDGKVFLITESKFQSGLIDLTRERVRQWYASNYLAPHFTENLAIGAMMDFSENYPLTAKPEPETNLTALEAHQLYPEFWSDTIFLAQQIYEKNKDKKQKDLLFFRRGFTHRARPYMAAPKEDTCHIWMGDQMTGWGKNNGLASILPYALSLGLSGKPYFHFDLGLYSSLSAPSIFGRILRLFGVTRERSRELMLRCMELSAFMSLMRSHEGMHRGMQLWDSEEMISHLGRCQKIFEALKPSAERWEQQEYRVSGAPLIRPMWWEGMQMELSDQAMYGKDIVFKPIVTENARSCRIWLPKGANWVHVFTGEKKVGIGSKKSIYVDAPLGQPAVFVREGAQAEREMRSLL